MRCSPFDKKKVILINLVVYLNSCPVMFNNNPDILEAGKDGDYHPGDQETMTVCSRSKYQHQGTDYPGESIKEGIFKKRTQTYFFFFAFVDLVITTSVIDILDGVEDGGDDGDAKLNVPDDEYRSL